MSTTSGSQVKRKVNSPQLKGQEKAITTEAKVREKPSNKKSRHQRNSTVSEESVDYSKYVYPSNAEEYIEVLAEPFQKISYSKPLTDKETEMLASALKVAKSVKCVNFNGNGFGESNIKILAQGLSANTSLNVVMLYKNALSVPSMAYLADAVKLNKNIERVFLYDNKITDDGIKPIVQALLENTTLKFLLLERNQLTDSGAEEVASCLRVNKSLDKLVMADNPLSDEWKEAIKSKDWRQGMLALWEVSLNKYLDTEVGKVLQKYGKADYAKAFYEKEILTLDSASMLTRDEFRSLGAKTVGEIVSFRKIFGKPAHLATEVGKILSDKKLEKYSKVFYRQTIHERDVAVLLEDEDFNELGITDHNTQQELLNAFGEMRLEEQDEKAQI